jgi:hypothetical protein
LTFYWRLDNVAVDLMGSSYLDLEAVVDKKEAGHPDIQQFLPLASR